jgi:hypothetical protein
VRRKIGKIRARLVSLFKEKGPIFGGEDYFHSNQDSVVKFEDGHYSLDRNEDEGVFLTHTRI